LSDLGLAAPQFIYEAGRIHALQDVEIVPWGWTESVVTLAKARGWRCALPSLDVVRRVNSRAFRFALEQEWNVGLAGAALANSLAELDRTILQSGAAPRGWLLKANFGMSGREAVRGHGRSLEENIRNWAEKRFIAGPIVFEPIVERVAEAGIQFEIPQSGPPQLVGIAPLLVDRSGVYRGSRFGSSATEIEHWQPAADVGMRVAQTAQRLGYFGPLGIDAMQFRDETGEIRLRPLQDLNARYTMGRLALGFNRILPTRGCGSWLHFHRRHLAGRDLNSWLDCLRDSLPAGVRLAATSPPTIGLRSVEHHAALLLAPSSGARRQAESLLLGNLGISVEGDRERT
jgi:hypothetical protein